MTKRIIPYIVAVLCVLSAAAGCEQADIYSEVDFNVTLDAGNTYQVGDPVVFNISGDPDNLIFYSGEPGHEYIYRNRYQTSAETVDSVVLFMQIQHRQGPTKGDNEALEIYYTDQFNGLAGDDPDADRAMVNTMYTGGMQGWTRIPYDSEGQNNNEYDPVRVKFPDVSVIEENFCLAFFWNPNRNDTQNTFMDTYWVIGNLTVYFPGGVEMTYTLNSIMGQTLMMDTAIDDIAFDNYRGQNAYLVNNGNGSIRLNATQDIVFAGAYYKRPDYDSSLDYNTRSWLFSIPRAFLTIEADQAEVIRNLQTDVDSFEHVYTEPGSYTVTFVGSNTVGFPDPGKNYQESSTQVKEFILNIIPPVLEVPGGSQSE